MLKTTFLSAAAVGLITAELCGDTINLIDQNRSVNEHHHFDDSRDFRSDRSGAKRGGDRDEAAK